MNIRNVLLVAALVSAPLLGATAQPSPSGTANSTAAGSEKSGVTHTSAQKGTTATSIEKGNSGTKSSDKPAQDASKPGK